MKKKIISTITSILGIALSASPAYAAVPSAGVIRAPLAHSTTPAPGVVVFGHAPASHVGILPTSKINTSNVKISPNASTTTTTTPSSTANPSPMALQTSYMGNTFNTLSSALVFNFAKQQNLSFSNFLQSNSASLSSFLGANASTIKAATTPAQLSSNLLSSNLTMSPLQFSSLPSFSNALTSSNLTPDAVVMKNGAAWASQLASLHMPSLTSPSVVSPNVPATPASALVFGDYLDKSLANMASSFPNVYAQVSKSGIGSPAQMQAWNSSMLSAVGATHTDFNKMLPSPCTASFLSSMGSGSPSSVGACAPCATAGVFMHSKMSNLFNPSSNSASKTPTKSFVPPAAYSALPSWQKGIIQSQNKNLFTQLNNSISNQNSSTLSCSSAKAASGNTVSSTLPGIFSQLLNGK